MPFMRRRRAEDTHRIAAARVCCGLVLALLALGQILGQVGAAGPRRAAAPLSDQRRGLEREAGGDDASVDLVVEAGSVVITSRWGRPVQSLRAGERAFITAQISNRGSSAAPPFAVVLMQGGWALAAWQTRVPLVPRGRVFAKLPWRTEAGEHQLAVVVDPLNAVRESDESNNAVAIEVEISRPWRPAWRIAILPVAGFLVGLAGALALGWRRRTAKKSSV